MQKSSSYKPSDLTTPWWQSDDAWAMIMAASVLAITWFALLPVLLPATGETSFENLLSPWVAKPGGWSANPLTAFHGLTQEGGPSKAAAVLATAVGCITCFCTRARWHRYSYFAEVCQQFQL